MLGRSYAVEVRQLGSRDEATHLADPCHEATPIVARDADLEHFLALKESFGLAPVTLLLCPAQRKEDVSILVLSPDYVDHDLFANLEITERFF